MMDDFNNKPRVPYNKYKENKGKFLNDSKEMRKMDYLKFLDMSVYPAKKFVHYGSFVVPMIGDKVIEDGNVYVVVDRRFNYDEECTTIIVERV